MIMSVQFSSEHCSHVCHDHVSQNEGTSLVTDQLDTHTTAPASPVDTAELTFADLNLPNQIQRAVDDLGFTVPSKIQQQAIPVLFEGRDITGIAQTGTGKTAAFGIPLLASIDTSVRQVQALVLAPTRELAIQVSEAIESFARHMPGLETLAVYGGSPYPPQIRALKTGVHVVVGTPGRVIDHIERGTLDLSQVRFLVLDEADEMLRMGFADDVEKVFSETPADRQVALFSATMPPAIRRVAQRHLTNPVEIAVARQSTTVTAIDQEYAVVPFRHKTGSLYRVLATSDVEAAIVFCRTRGAAEEVGAALIERGVSAATISGDVPQKDREKIVERLRNGQLDVLVATDVAARGLDVDRIGLVVNFDIPGEPEAYVHRIGRTGRAGRQGRALSFITPAERGKLRSIERTIRTELKEIPIPSPADVSEHKMRTMLTNLSTRIEAGRLSMYEQLIDSYLADSEHSATTVAAALAALAVGDSGPRARADQEEYERQVADEASSRRQASSRTRGDDRGRSDRPARERSGRPARSRDGEGTTYRIAVGYNDGAQPRGIVGALTNEGGLRGSDVGRINMFATFSLVDISADLDEPTMARIAKARLGSKSLRIRLDDGGPRGGSPRRGGRDEYRDSHPGASRRGGRSERGGARHDGHRSRRDQPSWS
ncbi:DEAD/DEAH box helicase [Jonesia denitrificans]|uniref:RNA helicase n=1 Tax=Jonesia denitrificans (strain ATCC 14870 / DSM 20603 / BCRC 15368 / CIP 55.134 / JCM 11481 / NBRC 15587 / NCTC 10816 / Prevot 55134) TaxID=471856 RepID=C7R4A6_JONDD|nr:DEAD/DEAH box helicase domain protein [Jonesia denitrificans DSM 20603]SQH21045.1 Cold-shock DEAD box protein A [Jonesia denitrificans]